MKKVFVIVDKNTTEEQMEAVREAILDPNRPCVVGNEVSIKQVINVEFDDVAIEKCLIRMELDAGKLVGVIDRTIKEFDSNDLIKASRLD